MVQVFSLAIDKQFILVVFVLKFKLCLSEKRRLWNN